MNETWLSGTLSLTSIFAFATLEQVDGDKRAIALEDHNAIVARGANLERCRPTTYQ